MRLEDRVDRIGVRHMPAPVLTAMAILPAMDPIARSNLAPGDPKDEGTIKKKHDMITKPRNDECPKKGRTSRSPKPQR